MEVLDRADQMEKGKGEGDKRRTTGETAKIKAHLRYSSNGNLIQ